MKKANLPIYEKEVLALLPTTQINIRKHLGISSQDVSDALEYLLSRNPVKRTKIIIDGKQTYYLEYLQESPKKVSPKKNYLALMNHGFFSPCTACPLECEAIHCDRLDNWLKVP